MVSEFPSDEVIRQTKAGQKIEVASSVKNEMLATCWERAQQGMAERLAGNSRWAHLLLCGTSSNCVAFAADKRFRLASFMKSCFLLVQNRTLAMLM